MLTTPRGRPGPELCHLQVTDVDSARMVPAKGKGNKIAGDASRVCSPLPGSRQRDKPRPWLPATIGPSPLRAKRCTSSVGRRG
jgi:hypothetical protein